MTKTRPSSFRYHCRASNLFLQHFGTCSFRYLKKLPRRIRYPASNAGSKVSSRPKCLKSVPAASITIAVPPMPDVPDSVSKAFRNCPMARCLKPDPAASSTNAISKQGFKKLPDTASTEFQCYTICTAFRNCWLARFSRPKCLKPVPATSGSIAVLSMLEARHQKAARYCQTVSTAFRNCWLARFNNPKCLKPVPAASGTIAVLPMLEARLQKPTRHCFYSILKGRFQVALPCFQCWKQSFKKLPGIAVRHCFNSLSKLLAGMFQQAQMPKTRPGSFGTIALNAESKASKTARGCFYSILKGRFQVALPCFQCWKQSLKKLPGIAVRHCFYSLSKLLAGTFQQAQRCLKPVPAASVPLRSMLKARLQKTAKHSF